MNPDFRKCLMRAAALFDVEPQAILTTLKKPLLTKARHSYWYSLYRAGHSMEEIAAAHGRDRTSIRYGIDRAAGYKEARFLADTVTEAEPPKTPETYTVSKALARHNPAERLTLTLKVDGKERRYKSVMKPSGWAWEKDDFDYKKLKGNNYGNNCTY